METDYESLIKEEGDYYTWEYHGLKCEIIRNGDFGNWCGYVTIPKIISTNIPEYLDMRVHGGLTADRKDSDGNRIIGFDAAHAGDLIPGFNMYGIHRGGIYRDKNFMIRETTSLARQILFI